MSSRTARCQASAGDVRGSSWANSRTRSRLVCPPVRQRLISSVLAPLAISPQTERNTSLPGSPRWIRFRRVLGGGVEAGQYDHVRPAPGQHEPVGQRSARLAAVQRRRGPAVGVLIGDRSDRPARSAAGTACCRRTTAAGGGGLSSTAPGTTAASCSKAVSRPRCPRRWDTACPPPRPCCPPDCGRGLARCRAKASGRSGCGTATISGCVCPSTVTCNASNGRYQSTPSGTIANSSKDCEKIGRRALQQRVQDLPGRLLPLRVGEVLDGQFVVRSELAHLAEHGLHLFRQRLRRADLPMLARSLFSRNPYKCRLGGEEDQDGVFVGERFLHVRHGAQGGKDQAGRLAPQGDLPQNRLLLDADRRQLGQCRICSFNAGGSSATSGCFAKRRADCLRPVAKACSYAG